MAAAGPVMVAVLAVEKRLLLSDALSMHVIVE